MFEFEKSVGAWRQQMLAAGIKTPAPLEELEIHLREEIERQVKSGLNEQKAFEISVQRIGQPEIITSEFNKTERLFMNRTAKVGVGVAGVLIGMALTIPGSVQLRDELVMADGKFGLWLLGGFLICWSFALFQQIFLPKVLKGEFENARMTPVKQTMKIGAGIVVLLIGVALMMPAAVQVRQEGMVEFAGLCYAVFGIALLITGALVAFWPYKKRKA
jgi:uncharacterized membrane protein